MREKTKANKNKNKKNKTALAYQKAKFIKAETKKHIGTAIAAAFAFIIALAWRDVITDIVDTIISSIGVTKDTYWLKIIAALIVTIIAVLGIAITAKITAKQEQKSAESEKKIKK